MTLVSSNSNDTLQIEEIKSKFRWPVMLLLFVVGVAICVLLVHELGSASLQEALWSLSVYVPVLLLIEGGRFVAELVSAQCVLRRAGAQTVPLRLLIRAQCVAHACNKVMPAGRATGEALKAAVLAPAVGTAKAMGAGAAAQIMTLLVNGMVAAAAGVVAYAMGAPREAIALGGYGVMGTLLGVVVLVSLKSPHLTCVLDRFRLTRGLVHHAHEMMQCGTNFGGWALFWHGGAKVAQTLQLGVLLFALGQGIAPLRALVAEGVQIVGAAAGDLLPAQLGATEGAFTLASSSLGISASAGLSLAVVLHGTQLIFAALTLVAAVLLRLVHRQTSVPVFAELTVELSE